ncbi:MAG: recombinase family protein, partial [Lachnoclostridium sp.]|nr:recombinase family protein [Lachnoclostridium sp.]
IIPTVYARDVLGINRVRTYKDDTDWSKTSIAEIIRNKVYLGHTVSQKASTISFKNKTRYRIPEDEHITVLDTHEPLISPDIFEAAQKVFSTKNPGNKFGFENIFVGVLKCANII